MLIVGLTGLIGSGKSTVADIFAKLGVAIIDTDIIAHQLTAAGGLAVKPIVAEFGDRVINADGSLNRARLRNLAFSSPQLCNVLEQVLHPLIFDRVKAQLVALTAAKYVIVVVPLLFKAQQFQNLVQRSLVVDCDYSQLFSRLYQRSGLDRAAVERILANQVSRENQLRLADDVITNSGELEQLVKQVNRLHKKYLLINETISDG